MFISKNGRQQVWLRCLFSQFVFLTPFLFSADFGPHANILYQAEFRHVLAEKVNIPVPNPPTGQIRAVRKSLLLKELYSQDESH